MILAIALFGVLVISAVAVAPRANAIMAQSSDEGTSAVAVAPRANAIMTNKLFSIMTNSEDDALGPIVPGLDNDIMTQHGDCTPLPHNIAC